MPPPPPPPAVSCGQRFVFTLTAAVAVQDVTDALVVDVFPEGVVPLAVSPQAFCDVDNINQQVQREGGRCWACA